MPCLRVAYLASSMQNLGGAERVKRAVLTQLNRAVFAPRALFLKEAGELGRQLTAQGVPTVELGIRRRTEFLKGLMRLFRHFRQQPVDILFTAEDKICMASAALARRFGVVPRYVVCFHGTRTWRGFTGGVHAFAVRSADKVVALSPRHKAFWQQYYHLHDNKITVIPNGIELERYHLLGEQEKAELRQQLGLVPHRITVGQVSFFKDSKNLPKGFVPVAKRVVESGVDAQFVLVGDGPERPALEESIWQHGLQTCFYLPGITNEPQLWYSILDVALMTSLTEAFPLTLIEAGASGVPVVATDVAGIPDIVAHGETGFLASPTELDKLAQYVVQLARDPELRQRMGAAGRQRALAEFDVKVMVERYAQMFREVAQRS